jgi:UDP-N-acetylmuramyl pentapeptide phosphotransferase/UDP-N-acetylglucosamine-1-phosphate transferase
MQLMQPSLLSLPVFGLLAALLSLAACGAVRHWLRQSGILDRPNDRSSHITPTPRGGGLGVMAAILPFSLGVGIDPALLTGMILLIGVSWLDDRISLAPLPRFGAQILAIGLCLSQLAPTDLVLRGLVPLELDRFLVGFAWLWFVNLTNFMDGIDGITGVQTISTMIGAALLIFTPAALPFETAALAFVLAGAAFGFLYWNWPKASLFLGDVGSVPLGFLMGAVLLQTALSGHLLAALILPLYPVTDATLTLLHRAIKREKIWQAHRCHFYQQAAQSRGHKPVLIAIIAGNSGLLVTALAADAFTPFLALLAPVIVFVLFYKLHAMRRPA